jgi:endonuclease YncB( thermonuclease family)
MDRQQKRLIPAFFCFCFFPFLLCAEPEDVNLCSSRTFDQVITIKRVIDGDTVTTEGDRHIRLIGIDTPEMNYKTNDPETGARAAREHLTRLLPPGARAGMVFDEERQDQYRRVLAHLFLPDGTNLQSSLLERGLAVPFIFPPNLKYVRCYHRISNLAREQGLGIWQTPGYQPVSASAVSDTDSGFRIIHGKIMKVEESKYLLKLYFNDRLIVTIRKSHLKNFPSKDINDILGNQIQVRGELYSRDGKLWMAIRHPLDLTIQSTMDNSSGMEY